MKLSVLLLDVNLAGMILKAVVAVAQCAFIGYGLTTVRKHAGVC